MSDEARVGERERYARALRSVAVSFRGGKASAAANTQSAGQAVRVIEEGRLGVASRFGAGSAESDARMLGRALEAAAAGDAPGFAFAPPEPARGEPPTWDEATVRLEVRDLEATARAAIDRIAASLPDLAASIAPDIDLSASERSSTLELTSGERLEERASLFSATVALSLPLAGDLINSYGESCARNPVGVAERATERALHWLARARERASFSSGATRVLFAPEAVSALLDPLVLGLDGLEAAFGTSALAESMGDAIWDPRLSLIDDGLHPQGVASSRWDGEGVARRRTELIAAGELRSFYHDLRSAARMATVSTGNAVRDDLLPSRAPGNWCLEVADPMPLERLLREAGPALLVVELLGVGQTATRDGSFANPVALGFKIEDGQIVGRVSDLTIAGNAFELLRGALVGAGDDALWTTRLGFPLRAPTLLFDRVAVTVG